MLKMLNKKVVQKYASQILLGAAIFATFFVFATDVSMVLNFKAES